MTDIQKPTEGWYDAYAEKACFHIGKPDEEGKSSLCVLINYRLVDSGFPMAKYHTLFKKDGSVMARRDGTSEREVLERRYGWDLSDPEFSAESMSPDIIVRVKVEEKMFNGKIRPEIAIVMDGNGDQSEKPDAKTIQAKFGKMLRATGSKIGRPSSGPGAPSAPPCAAPPPAAPSGSSTQQECWELFLRADRTGNPDKWWELLAQVNGKKQQDEYSAQDWFNVACAIRKNLGVAAAPEDTFP